MQPHLRGKNTGVSIMNNNKEIQGDLKHRLHSEGFNIVAMNRQKIWISKQGLGMRGLHVYRDHEPIIEQYILESINWGIQHSKSPKCASAISFDWDKGRCPKELRRYMSTRRWKEFGQESFHGIIKVVDADQKWCEEFVSNYGMPGLEMFVKNQTLAMFGTFDTKENHRVSSWNLCDDLTSTKNFVKHVSKSDLAFMPKLESNTKNVANSGKTSLVSAGQGLRHNAIVLATFGILRLLPRDSKNVGEIFDKVVQLENIERMSEYKTGNKQQELMKTIEWCIENYSTERIFTIRLLTEILLEKYTIRVLVDTGEFIIWHNSHYKVDMRPNEKLLRGTLEEYDPDIKRSVADEVIYRIRNMLSLRLDRDELNKQNGRAFSNGWLDYTTGKLVKNNAEQMNTTHIDYEIELSERASLSSLDKEYTIDDINDILGKDSFINKSLKLCHTNSNTGKLDFENYYSVLEGDAEAVFANDCKMRTAYLHYGPTFTGKSKHLEFLSTLLGPKNCTAITIHDLLTDKFKKARLFGKLANINADMDTSLLKGKQGEFKGIIAGDIMTGEYKGVDSFEFIPIATHHYSLNEFPTTFEQSDAWFIRFKIIYWNHYFKKGVDKDSLINEKIFEDRKDIAKYLGLLYLVYQKMRTRDGLRYVESAADNRQKWNDNSDPLGRYIQEVIVHTDTNEMTTEKLLDYCNVWLLANSHSPMRLRSFNKAIREILGVNTVITKVKNEKTHLYESKQVWEGISIKPEYKYDTLDAYNKAHKIE